MSSVISHENHETSCMFTPGWPMCPPIPALHLPLISRAGASEDPRSGGLICADITLAWNIAPSNPWKYVATNLISGGTRNFPDRPAAKAKNGCNRGRSISHTPRLPIPRILLSRATLACKCIQRGPDRIVSWRRNGLCLRLCRLPWLRT